MLLCPLNRRASWHPVNVDLGHRFPLAGGNRHRGRDVDSITGEVDCCVDELVSCVRILPQRSTPPRRTWLVGGCWPAGSIASSRLKTKWHSISPKPNFNCRSPISTQNLVARWTVEVATAVGVAV